MKEIVSGEEKLLKLIRGNKNKPAVAVEPGLQSVQIPTLSFASRIKQFFGRLPFLGPAVDFTVEKFVFLFLIFAVIYALVVFVYPFMRPAKLDLEEVIKRPDFADKKTGNAQKSNIEVKPLEFYTQGLGGRQIFSASALAGSAASSVIAAADSDLIKNINLVGIISGDRPQAIIEDKKTNKSYYLTKGQFIGEVKIEDIQEGKVILNHKGQAYELYL